MKYKLFYLALISLLIISCGTSTDTKTIEVSNQEIIYSFAEIISNSGTTGSILIYDIEKGKYYSNDFEHCETGFLPAPTFKIANSIIALETGVIENDSTLLVWDKEPRNMEIWEQDLYFREAFHFSCVPCYQEIALKIGVETMNEYLAKLEYGNMNVYSNNLDVF